MFDYLTCFSCASFSKENVSADIEIETIEIESLDQTNNVKIKLDALINLNCSNFHFDDKLYVMRLKKFKDYKQMRESVTESELNSKMKLNIYFLYNIILF
jgi:hypothetical protein